MMLSIPKRLARQFLGIWLDRSVRTCPLYAFQAIANVLKEDPPMQTPSKTSRHGTPCRLAVLVLLFVSNANAESPLRWKFKEGEDLNYVMERAVDGKINLSGADIEFKLKMVFDTTWNVKSVAADGTASVEQALDRMQVSMDSPLGGSLEYDSKNPTKPDSPAWAMLAPMVEGMLGQTLKWKVSPLGKVSDIEMPQKLADIFAKQAQGGNRQQGFGLGGNMFSDRGIREFIEKSVLPLPEKAPAKDVTWKQHFENPIPRIGNQLADTTFSFAGTEIQDGKNVQKISGVTELTFEPDDDAAADLEITSQSGSASFSFDPAAGRAIKADGTQASTLELSGARELTQEIKETTSIRVGKSPAGKTPAKEDKDAKPAAK
jgi:hypothetical protein